METHRPTVRFYHDPGNFKAISPGLSIPTSTMFYVNAHLVCESCSQSRLLCSHCCPTPSPLTWPLGPVPQNVHLFVLLILAPHILGETP